MLQVFTDFPSFSGVLAVLQWAKLKPGHHSQKARAKAWQLLIFSGN